MVGPWLFWLGPMILRAIYFSFLWHGMAWHCFSFPGIAMTSHDDH